ncbi:MAG: ADP-ribosylation factor GTPase-activating protein 2 [Paramarteilia canceri]
MNRAIPSQVCPRSRFDEAFGSVFGSDLSCSECGRPAYQPWLSVTYGILLCINCAGKHRSLGTSTSRVMDTHLGATFTEYQLRTMLFGGNNKFSRNITTQFTSIKDKYNSPAVKNYRKQLEDLVEKSFEADLEINVKSDAEKFIKSLNSEEHLLYSTNCDPKHISSEPVEKTEEQIKCPLKPVVKSRVFRVKFD